MNEKKAKSRKVLRFFFACTFLAVFIHGLRRIGDGQGISPDQSWYVCIE